MSLTECGHLGNFTCHCLSRASVWMKAETKFTNPDALHHDRVARFDRHAAGQRTIFVKILTSMSFSGDRAFKWTARTFTLSELQPELTRNCLLLGRFANRCSMPKLSEALKTPASGLGEQERIDLKIRVPPSCRNCVKFFQMTRTRIHCRTKHRTECACTPQAAPRQRSWQRRQSTQRELGETMVVFKGTTNPASSMMGLCSHPKGHSSRPRTVKK